MANIKDVAREAGVSVATVSRIMNNRGSISESTRQKVFAVMKELDYRPNEMARYLQTGRSNIVGLVIPYIDHPVLQPAHGRHHGRVLRPAATASFSAPPAITRSRRRI